MVAQQLAPLVHQSRALSYTISKLTDIVHTGEIHGMLVEFICR